MNKVLFFLVLPFQFFLSSCQQEKKGEFSWLEGTWVMKDSSGGMGETWIHRDTDIWEARSFSFRSTDTSYYETVRLAKLQGRWNYTVTSVGQNQNKPVAFTLTSEDHQIYIFENPAHDFPKRIIYRLIKPDSIHASIDGGKQLTGQEQHFYYNRIK